MRLMSQLTWAWMVTVTILLLAVISFLVVIKEAMITEHDIACLIENSMASHHSTVVAPLDGCNTTS
jgi:hypothetical protein